MYQQLNQITSVGIEAAPNISIGLPRAENPREDSKTPEVRLMSAVLLKALDDLKYVAKVKELNSRETPTRWADQTRALWYGIAKNAVGWFFRESNNSRVMSCKYCCDVLGLEFADVLRLARHRFDQARRGEMPESYIIGNQ